MNKRINVDADSLLLMMDRLSDVFKALDDVAEAYKQFVESTVYEDDPNDVVVDDQHGHVTPDNVVDLDERRIEKNQSDIYFE